MSEQRRVEINPDLVLNVKHRQVKESLIKHFVCADTNKFLRSINKVLLDLQNKSKENHLSFEKAKEDAQKAIDK